VIHAAYGVPAPLWEQTFAEAEDVGECAPAFDGVDVGVPGLAPRPESGAVVTSA